MDSLLLKSQHILENTQNKLDKELSEHVNIKNGMGIMTMKHLSYKHQYRIYDDIQFKSAGFTLYSIHCHLYS